MEGDVLRALFAAFAKEKLRYKVVGGVALNLQGLIRATEDLDVFVAPDEENVNRLRAALRSVFDDPHIDEITSSDLGGDYPAVQYVPPVGEGWIDVMARLGTAFTFDDIEVEERDVEGTRVPVATPSMLYRMKKDTVRPQDRLDAAVLRERFGLDD